MRLQSAGPIVGRRRFGAIRLAGGARHRGAAPTALNHDGAEWPPQGGHSALRDLCREQELACHFALYGHPLTVGSQ